MSGLSQLCRYPSRVLRAYPGRACYAIQALRFMLCWSIQRRKDTERQAIWNSGSLGVTQAGARDIPLGMSQSDQDCVSNTETGRLCDTESTTTNGQIMQKKIDRGIGDFPLLSILAIEEID